MRYKGKSHDVAARVVMVVVWVGVALADMGRIRVSILARMMVRGRGVGAVRGMLGGVFVGNHKNPDGVLCIVRVGDALAMLDDADGAQGGVTCIDVSVWNVGGGARRRCCKHGPDVGDGAAGAGVDGAMCVQGGLAR